MAKHDPYKGCVIQAEDTDAAKLTIEQADSLVWFYWVHDKPLSHGVPLQELLNLWHASIEWCSFQGWLEEKPEEAAAAYNRCISDPSKHFSVGG